MRNFEGVNFIIKNSNFINHTTEESNNGGVIFLDHLGADLSNITFDNINFDKIVGNSGCVLVKNVIDC